ncbi:transglycosylase SLT domain-containing protein [Pseudohongiella nitratireducens]|uniref:transglycosylase SLT domain-containing protein n=1 Tax=Pseudohongiella nitratireducens TaxID=1768907 RepID=UPI0030EDC70C
MVRNSTEREFMSELHSWYNTTSRAASNLVRHTNLMAIMLICLILPDHANAQSSDWSDERQLFQQAQEALAAREMEQFNTMRQQLAEANYPLLPYLDYAELEPRLGSLPFEDVDKFLADYQPSYLAARLERQWVATLAELDQEQALIRYFNPDNSYTQLTCQALLARHNQGDASVLDQAPALWNVARSQPNECDPLFDAWMDADGLTPELIWERFEKNMQAGNRNLASYISTLMPVDDKALADLWLNVDRRPERLASDAGLENTDPRVRPMILRSLRKLANIDAAQALLQLNHYREIHQFSNSEMSGIQRYIALRLLFQGFVVETESLIQNTPTLQTDVLVGWLIRDALADLDWQRVQKWLALLPDETRNSERWRYWRARATQAISSDEHSQQQSLSTFQELAESRSYYGYLSADRVDEPYALTHIPAPTDASTQLALLQRPSVQRAYELLQVGEEINARNEWRYLQSSLNDHEVAASGVLAKNWQWHRESIQAMIRIQHWDDLELRFPVAYLDSYDQAFQDTGLDTTYLYAITRQESAFMADVVSPVGARGLMQLMPGTAGDVSRNLGLSVSRNDLFEPSINIRLGSEYLSQMIESFHDNRILATAAYNAGPNRVRQWLRDQAQTLPADVWVETIPFLETRQYVQNVLVYAVIYGHRLGRPQAFLQPSDLEIP